MRLSRDGLNAGDVLKHLEPKDKDWIEARLAAAVPGIQSVLTDTIVGRRVIRFVQSSSDGDTEAFDASAMSDGTLRSLGILLALRQSPRPSIVMLDEIEDSLHPLAHGALLDAIEAASEEFPVVVSTHNPEILSHPAARPERIRVIQWDEGRSRIYQLSDNVRADLKPPLTVGQLLRANALWTDDRAVNDRCRGRLFQALMDPWSKYVIVPIVEGHGEVAAVPILLERWLTSGVTSTSRSMWPDPFAPRDRGHRGRP